MTHSRRVPWGATHSPVVNPTHPMCIAWLWHVTVDTAYGKGCVTRWTLIPAAVLSAAVPLRHTGQRTGRCCIKWMTPCTKASISSSPKTAAPSSLRTKNRRVRLGGVIPPGCPEFGLISVASTRPTRSAGAGSKTQLAWSPSCVFDKINLPCTGQYVRLAAARLLRAGRRAQNTRHGTKGHVANEKPEEHQGWPERL